MSPLPRRLARANKRLLNKVLRHAAPRLPGFALLTHRGRTSGRAYTIPVNVFERDGRYVFALTYGARTDWVRNVLAAGGCCIVTRGRRIELTDPRLEGDPARLWAPPVVRQILGVVHADETLVLVPR